MKPASGGPSCGGGQRSFRVFALLDCAVGHLAQQAGIMVQRADVAPFMDGPCWAITNSGLASGVSRPRIRRPFADATLRALMKSACIRSDQLNAIWSLGAIRGVLTGFLPVAITSLCALPSRGPGEPGCFPGIGSCGPVILARLQQRPDRSGHLLRKSIATTLAGFLSSICQIQSSPSPSLRRVRVRARAPRQSSRRM